MATEVYLSRAKQSLRKKMRVEWNSLLSIEHFESINCWATLTELQTVIPFYEDKYYQIVKLCKTGGGNPHDLSFATSFIVSLFFLRVKGTFFKTNEKYGFDSLVFTDETLQLIKLYTDHVRTKLAPKCDYVLVCKNGKQLSNLGDIFGRMVYQAIGKYVNPTRYRQIIETESAKLLSVNEQSLISLDQKHTSNVAKVHYQKLRSREVAQKSSECMKKMIQIGKSAELENNENSIVDKEIEESDDDGKEYDLTITTKSNEKSNEPISKAEKLIDSTRRKKCTFSKEEDNFLIKGIKKYGKGKWTSILNDPEYKFHPSRKNSTLIMRAKAKKFI